MSELFGFSLCRKIPQTVCAELVSHFPSTEDFPSISQRVSDLSLSLSGRGRNNEIFISQLLMSFSLHQLYLPSREELKAQLEKIEAELAGGSDG